MRGLWAIAQHDVELIIVHPDPAPECQIKARRSRMYARRRGAFRSFQYMKHKLGDGSSTRHIDHAIDVYDVDWSPDWGLPTTQQYRHRSADDA